MDSESWISARTADELLALHLGARIAELRDALVALQLEEAAREKPAYDEFFWVSSRGHVMMRGGVAMRPVAERRASRLVA